MPEKKKTRVFIGIPCFDRPSVETFEDYMRFAFYLGRRYPDCDFWLGIKTKSEQFRARNEIIRAAYQMDCDYCLQLDDDHIIDIARSNYPHQNFEFLHKLLSHMEDDKNLGLVGARYYHRGGQCRPVVLIKDENTPGKFRYLRDDEIKNELQPVAIQGGGCMLIRMKAMDFIPDPWFEPELELGTDFQICTKMNAAGWKVASDTSIEIGHVENERRVITSENRHISQAESGKNAKDIEIAGQLGHIYERYRKDILEYLGLENEGLMIKLGKTYKEHIKKFDNFINHDEYYQNGGPAYLARAAYINNPYFDDYLLKVVRAGVPGIGIDFGCGSGRITFELARKGHMISFFDVPGVETYKFLEWRAKKYGIFGATVLMDMSWPEDGTADYAIFADSIEHLMDWKTPIKKAITALKDGGVIISNFLMNEDVTNPEHINMDKAGFSAFMSENGMTPINATTFQKNKIKGG